MLGDQYFGRGQFGANTLVVVVRSLTLNANSMIANSRAVTQPATAHISGSRATTQPAVARATNARNRTQTAIAAIKGAGSRTQPALARTASVFSRAQTAAAATTSLRNRTQPAVAKISNTFFLQTTQPAIAGVAVVFTKTQSTIARTSRGFSLTQSSVARMITNTGRAATQGATARIANTGVSPGNLVVNGFATSLPTIVAMQTAQARWLDGTALGSASNVYHWFLSKGAGGNAQFDPANPLGGYPSLHVNLPAVNSFVELRNDSAAYYTTAQNPIKPNTTYLISGWIKAANVSGSSTTGGNIGILIADKTGTSIAGYTLVTGVLANQGWTYYEGYFTTLSTAAFAHVQPMVYGHTGAGTMVGDWWFAQLRMQEIGYNQTATARITNSRTKTQPAVAHLSKIGVLTQPATAHLSPFRSVTQTAAARIAISGVMTQPAVGRVAKIASRTQPAIARVGARPVKTQPALARVASTITRAQPAVARVVAIRLKTQPAIAAIVAQRTRTQLAVARVAQRPAAVIQTATAHIVCVVNLYQTATSAMTDTRARTQTAVAHMMAAASRTQPARASTVLTVTKTQPATATVHHYDIKYAGSAHVYPGNSLQIQVKLGDVIVVACSWNNTAGTPTISDNTGNSYTLRADQSASANFTRVTVWTAIANATFLLTITVGSGFSDMGVSADLFRGSVTVPTITAGGNTGARNPDLVTLTTYPHGATHTYYANENTPPIAVPSANNDTLIAFDNVHSDGRWQNSNVAGGSMSFGYNTGTTYTNQNSVGIAIGNPPTVRTATQPATAHIATVVAKTQPAGARIGQVYTKTQPVTAHMAVRPNKLQPATAKIIIRGSYNQPAHATVKAVAVYTTTATATLIATGQYTIGARARIFYGFMDGQRPPNWTPLHPGGSSDFDDVDQGDSGWTEVVPDDSTDYQ